MYNDFLDYLGQAPAPTRKPATTTQNKPNARIFIPAKGIQAPSLTIPTKKAKGDTIEVLTGKNSGLILVESYSERSFAIFGDTKPVKDKLIQMGGKFNPADWWQLAARHCVDFLTTYNKIKFVGPYGAKPISKKGEPINAPGTGNTIFAFGEMALDALRTGESNNFGMTHRGTPTVILVGVSPSWVDCITISLGRLNGKATLKDIYAAVEDLAPDKVQGNMHWREKVRQKLQDRFIRIEKGVYSKN